MSRGPHTPGYVRPDRRTPADRAYDVALVNAVEDAKRCRYCGADRHAAGLLVLSTSLLEGYRCASPSCMDAERRALRSES